MATEKLVVELDADTKKLDRSLTSSTKKIDELEGATNKADSSLSKFSTVAASAGGIVGAFGVAAVTAGAALSTMVVMAGKGQMELEQLARQAKLSTAEFEALSFATRQYGVDGEAIADISKDIADKLGEFAKVGTGPFQDIADVIGITKEGAQDLAVEFENMSSEQVIGELVRRMEDAGASSNEMTFALESMGNDLSKLLPLFANNGQALSTLKGQYTAATQSIKLTREEAEKLKESATAFDLLTKSLGTASDKILSKIAGPLTEFFTNLTRIVPLVTKDLEGFIASFNDDSIISKKEKLLELEKELAEEQKLYWERQGDGTNNRLLSASIGSIARKGEEITLLKEEIALLEKKQDIEDNPPPGDDTGGEGSGSSTGSGSGSGSGPTADEAAKAAEAKKKIEDEERAAIQFRLQTEREQLIQKYSDEVALFAENNEVKKQLAQELSDAVMDISDREAAANKRNSDKELARLNKEAREKERIEQGYLNAAKSLNNDLFEDNKAIGAGIIVADTAIGVQKALAQGGMFGWVQAAAIAASGVTQLSNLESASKGGGGISAGVNSAGAETDIGDQVGITSQDADSSGSREIVVRFEGDGSELTEALFNSMRAEEQSGAIG